MRAFDVSGNKVANLLGLAAKRARVDDGIVGIRIHIRYRKKIPLNADSSRLFAGDSSEVFGIFRISSGTNCHGIRKGCGSIQAVAYTQFKIRGHEQRELRVTLQAVQELGGFVRLVLVEKGRLIADT